tara:strand:- start:1874 stop:2095 length:222 start_codon:yes stop_codon:yes gene_type:complete
MISLSTETSRIIGIAGGALTVVAGTTACGFMIKHYDKSKRYWWLDAQLFLVGAATAAFAVSTASLTSNLLKKH